MAVNDGMLPSPDAGRPIDGSLLVQVNVTSPTVRVPGITSSDTWPLQSIWSSGVATWGVGSTVTITVAGPDPHPVAVTGVMV